jgi:hypothetical protein
MRQSVGYSQQGEDKYPMKTAEDVAAALDWVRWRMKGSGLLLVAVGARGLAYAADPKLAPEDAIRILEANMSGLRLGLNDLRIQKVSRGARRRDDVE